MANTLASALVPAVVRDTTVTVLQNKLGPLRAFARDFSTDAMAPGKVVQVPKATAGATAQTNATNFESGDSTLSNIAVTPAQLSVSFHLTQAQLNNGFRLQQLLEINLQKMADAILDAALAPVTAANFGAATVVTAANFGTDDLTTLWGLGKNFNRRHLVLDGSYLANFIPTDRFKFALGESGAYGFDAIYMNNRWNGAEANTTGFVADPQAIGLASGMSVLDDAVSRLLLSEQMITLPDIGLTVRFARWGSLASRTTWAAFDVMFGAALGDGSALKIVASA